MNPTTEQAHQSLQQVLLTGRILVNGMPLTANELSGILRGEQMLFEKASQLDKASAGKKENVVPIKEGKK